MIIDVKTKLLYNSLKEKAKDVKYVAWPEILCELEIDGYYDGATLNYRKRYEDYKGTTYGEWYRCLAFITYGYGNYSNNDRRRSGLPARRKSRR